MTIFGKVYGYLIVIFILATACAQPPTTPGGQNRTDEQQEADEYSSKVDSLIQLMTLEEKLGQLNMPAAGDITTGLAQNVGIAAKIAEGKVGALLNIQGIDKIHDAQRIAVEESRLGIPLIFAMDVIHGYKTIFPIPLGLSCTWNVDMIEKTARMAAREASAEGISLTFSPMVDISRDPRWGRISEGSGEDPFMQSEIARAMINGYQQDDLSRNTTLMSCVKHFALYGAPVAGRDYNTVDMSRLQMYNVYFPPFKAAVEENVGCVMAAFNDVDAIPATGSEWLMTEMLRNQWGFDGFVVTDYTGINEMTAHGLGDLQAVSELALEAGIDMDMVGEGFLTTLEDSYEEGKVSMADIDQAVRRVLTAKYKLGLFEDPYQYGDQQRSQQEVFSAEHREFAREVSAESLVLLKNDDDLLPLKADGTIAVIGPLVTNAENMTGTWSVAADFEKSVSLVEGIKNVVGDQLNLL
ncbi:MAG: glycoside hydrolase family 3 N-terminal domain-containing protein, partial [Bacteroidota bacterium]